MWQDRDTAACRILNGKEKRLGSYSSGGSRVEGGEGEGSLRADVGS